MNSSAFNIYSSSFNSVSSSFNFNSSAFNGVSSSLNIKSSSFNSNSSSLINNYDEDLMHFINFDSSKENGLNCSKIHNNPF